MPRSWSTILSEHLRVVDDLRALTPCVDAISERLIAALRAGGRMFICGNGGSAADAQHFAAELTGRFRKNRRALPAIALTTDTSALTAIGNDFSFEQVFSRQVEALARAGDVLIALSTSGNSPNILAAARAARTCGASVIGMSGANGGRLKELCELCFCAPHTDSDRIQEAHLIAYHYLCEQIEDALG